ncbi:MAG: hypothetical protein ACYCV4_12110 [Dermatophilaceae bacterium]
MALTFKIAGRSMTLEPEQVIRSLSGVEPEPIRSHAVDVQGTLYPTKQAFHLATGLDRLDFTTNQARTQFRRLGFKVVRMGPDK